MRDKGGMHGRAGCRPGPERPRISLAVAPGCGHGDAVAVSTAARWAGAAGAVVSTAEDVQRFFAALLRGRLLRPQFLREKETLVPAGRNRYGLGIAVFPTPCGPAWGHTGNVQGTVAVA